MAGRRKRSLLIILAAALTTALITHWFSTATTRPGYGEPITHRTAPPAPQSNDREPDRLVLLGFSGGGTRAAALAYGVLRELAQTTIATSAGNGRLLDEIDIISSVSGGSFTNAYFGLYGDGIFESFRETMLLRSIESDLVKALFDYRHWRDLASPYYGRSDMAAAYYDTHIFGSKTFADIPANGPWIIINASDIGSGNRMIFSRSLFDLLCLDFGSYPIARAVAASSAVPGVATPITIRSHAGSCGPAPPWLHTVHEAKKNTLLAAKLDNYLNLLDSDQIPWLHLMDGGITDNLGLRQFYEFMHLRDILEYMVDHKHPEDIKEVLLISVNAAVEHSPPWVNTPRHPSDAQVLAAMNHIEIGDFTADTIQLVTNAYDIWQAAMAKKGKTVHFDFVEVAFARLSDPEDRARMNALPTSLELSEDEVDALIEVGGRLLRESPRFQDFLARHPPAAGP